MCYVVPVHQTSFNGCSRDVMFCQKSLTVRRLARLTISRSFMDLGVTRLREVTHKIGSDITCHMMIQPKIGYGPNGFWTLGFKQDPYYEPTWDAYKYWRLCAFMCNDCFNIICQGFHVLQLIRSPPHPGYITEPRSSPRHYIMHARSHLRGSALVLLR